MRQANITRFIQFVNEKYALSLKSYWDLHRWSVENIGDFWAAMWDFVGVIASHRYERVVDDMPKFPGTQWFIGAQLNFAENLLRFRDHHLALTFRNESGKSTRMTYQDLFSQVGRLARSLGESGVAAGDRVGAYMPNIVETPVAMLSATTLGAVWASCGSELGATAVVDRLGQIEPKLLFSVDGYFYNGRQIDLLRNLEKIADGIPSLEKIIILPYARGRPDISSIPHSILYDDFLIEGADFDNRFRQLPFSHPVYIMFSSGTTGNPKCMVQSAGGVLINHLKELILHTDLKREDRITYITSPSWMMWNWLISSLAVGATIVLYDGNPNYPDWSAMWRLAEDERITIFGCSASYINYLRSVGGKPRDHFDLFALREISQTGSALSAEGFEWVFANIKEDIHFNSISGGTDINGCFACGCPTLPVHAGEIQAAALGMKVNAYDENGNPVTDLEGELVCEAPSPSMPLYFWNDPEGERYREAYFDFYKFTGRSVWRHGDYVVIHSDTRGITFYGRSDAVLKPAGVRIGTGEIYRVVESIPEIEDSLVVGQKWRDDERIILFVKLAPGNRLTHDLKDRIRKVMRENASPRHVPSLILEVPDIPYTYNMKKVEIAVRNLIHGKPVTNRDALVNPEALLHFERILPELQAD